jgi:sugar O-acyltransferase (sialic acid O-acetyltransferase NeuD family)
MNKIILGKSSNFLAFFLDVLYRNSPDDRYTIIRNVPDDAATLNVPYLIPEMKVKEYDFDSFNVYDTNIDYLLGVYSPKSKSLVYKFFLDKCNITNEMYQNTIASNVILPAVYTIGKGCFINYNSIISAYTTIHNFVTINRNVSIGHHCILHDFVTISPGTNIASHCEIGECTFIGIGTTILNNIKIGKNVIIGAGSLITKDIPDNTVYYGSPAKYIKDNI